MATPMPLSSPESRQSRRRTAAAGRVVARLSVLLVGIVVLMQVTMGRFGTMPVGLQTAVITETAVQPPVNLGWRGGSRRETLLGSLVGAAPAAVVIANPSLVGAEIEKTNWQMKLPPTWVSPNGQRSIPGLDDARPRELLLALGPQKAEVKVERIPLAVSTRDPQGLGGLALIDYFSTPQGQTPRVTTQQVVEILSKGFEQQPAIFSFSLVATPSERFQNTTKYLRYDFEAARCEGEQIQGVSGKVCQRSDNGEVLPVPIKHHAIWSTVVAEPTNTAKVADGLLVGDAGAEILWVVDISAPADSWPKIAEEAEKIALSFAVATESQLTAIREASTAGAISK